MEGTNRAKFRKCPAKTNLCISKKIQLISFTVAPQYWVGWVLVWWCDHMTFDHSRKWSDTSYNIRVMLDPVWSGRYPLQSWQCVDLYSDTMIHMIDHSPCHYRYGAASFMTCSHCRRFWIALYMYKEDLLWVWQVWGALIIRTKRDPPPIPTTSTLRSQMA